MAQKLWAYISGLITRPALEFTAPSTATSCPTTAKSVKAHNDWVTEDSAAISYIKMNCTKSVVAGIPTMHTTSKEVWDSLKERFNKASAAIMLQEIQQALSFRLSGGDPIHEISKLSAMFGCLSSREFTIPEFVHASILIMALPHKWDSVTTYLLQSHALDKLNWDLVSEAIISEFSCLQGSQPLTSVNKISAVKCKSNHPPSWKEKSREEQPNVSSLGDQQKKG